MVLEFALADAGAAAGGHARAEHGDAAEPTVSIASHAEVLSIAILAVHLKEGIYFISILTLAPHYQRHLKTCFNGSRSHLFVGGVARPSGVERDLAVGALEARLVEEAVVCDHLLGVKHLRGIQGIFFNI